MSKIPALLLAGLPLLGLLASCSVRDPKDPRFVVARVQSKDITRADLDARTSRVAGGMGIQIEQLDPSQKERLQWQILEDLVTRAIITEASASLDPKTLESQIEEEYTKISARAPSPEAFEQSLQQQGMTIGELKEELGMRARVSSLVDQRHPGGFQVTPEEALTFYNNNTSMFERPETVQARHILINHRKEQGPEAEKTSRASAESARKRVSKGEDFAKVAAEVSDDPGSKARGGDLPPFRRGQMVPEFEKVAFESETGKLSPVFQSPFGFHFLEVKDHQTAKTMTFDEVSPRLIQLLGQRQRQEATATLVDQLRTEIPNQILLQKPAEPAPAQPAMQEPATPAPNPPPAETNPNS